MSEPRWTIQVCDEGHANGPLWDSGCESCFALTRPVEVVAVKVTNEMVERAFRALWDEAEAVESRQAMREALEAALAAPVPSDAPASVPGRPNKEER